MVSLLFIDYMIESWQVGDLFGCLEIESLGGDARRLK